MRTFDDLLEYQLGDEVQLFEAPRQNPRNCFETGTKGKIVEFFENGLAIETEKGEYIRTYLPFVCCKGKSNEIEEKIITEIKENNKIEDENIRRKNKINLLRKIKLLKKEIR